MFDVVDVEKYLAYFSRLPEVAPQHGGRMVAFGRFRDDPELADLRPLREDGTASYVWQTFDGADMSDPTSVSLDEVLAVLRP